MTEETLEYNQGQTIWVEFPVKVIATSGTAVVRDYGTLYGSGSVKAAAGTVLNNSALSALSFVFKFRKITTIGSTTYAKGATALTVTTQSGASGYAVLADDQINPQIRLVEGLYGSIDGIDYDLQVTETIAGASGENEPRHKFIRVKSFEV